MLVKTKAIVLRNTPYSETSVISKMYTQDFGIRTYLINGVRKAKSKITMAMLQPMNILSLEAYEKPNANLQRIKELKCQPILFQIAQDVRKRSVAMFMTELLNACIVAEDSDDILFDFLEDEIIKLENGTEVSNTPLLFMTRLSKVLGIEPQGMYTEESPYLDLDQAIFTDIQTEHCVPRNVSMLISALKADSIDGHLKIESNTRRECLNSLILYYQLHIMRHKELKSLNVLSDVLEAWHTI